MPGFTTKFGIRKPLGHENIDEAELGLAFDRIDSVTPKVLGRRKITVSSAPIAGETIIPNSSIGFTITLGRLIEIAIAAHVYRSVVDGTSIIGCRLNPGGAFLQHLHFQPHLVGQGVPGSALIHLDNLAAGTYEAYLTLRNGTGTGTSVLDALADRPCTFIVKDIGPIAY